MKHDAIYFTSLVLSGSLCIFGPLLFVEKSDGAFAGQFFSATFANSLISSIVLLVPIVIENTLDILILQLTSKSYFNLILTAIVEVPSLMIFIYLRFAHNAMSPIILCLVLLQICFSYCGTSSYISTYMIEFDDQMLSKRVPFLFCMALGLNCFSHMLTNIFASIALVLSLFLCLLILMYFIKVFRYNLSSMNSINKYCCRVTLLSLFLLVLGCILLRLISLYAVDGMSIYINGLIVLSSLCTLPVFMLDGRIAKYNGRKNEVFLF